VKEEGGVFGGGGKGGGGGGGGGGDGGGGDVGRGKPNRRPLRAFLGAAPGGGDRLKRSRRRNGCGLRVDRPASAGAGRAQGCHDGLSFQHSGQRGKVGGNQARRSGSGESPAGSRQGRRRCP